MNTTNLVWAPNDNQSLPSTIPYSEQPLSSRPYPNWGVVNTRANGATATFEEAQVEVTHRVAAGLTLDSTYSWSHSLADNLGAGNAGSLCGETACNRSEDFYDRRSEKGNPFAPYRHDWVTTVVYQLPVGKGKRFANSDNKILNGGDRRMANEQRSHVSYGPLPHALLHVGRSLRNGLGDYRACPAS